MELNDVLRKVRILIDKATHEGTPLDEAEACQAKADYLMLQYAIDEAALDASRPAAERTKKADIYIDLGSSDMTYYIMDLIFDTARHCRCRAIRTGPRRGEDGIMNWNDHAWV